MKKLGVLTIGQSPRNDVTPSFKRIIGEDVRIIERGALDSLTESDILEIAPKDGDVTYISKLRNGTSVKINKAKLLPLLQAELNALEKEVDLTVLLCTGEFPTIYSTKPVLYPDRILVHMIEAVLSGGTLGLVIPLEEQRDSLQEKWKDTGLDLVVAVASPYSDSNFIEAGKELLELGADVIALDCMGYSEAHKKDVITGSGLPVIVSRTLVARIAKEYL